MSLSRLSPFFAMTAPSGIAAGAGFGAATLAFVGGGITRVGGAAD